MESCGELAGWDWEGLRGSVSGAEVGFCGWVPCGVSVHFPAQAPTPPHLSGSVAAGNVNVGH